VKKYLPQAAEQLVKEPIYITKAELAELLRLDVRTVGRLVATGDLPAPFKLGSGTRHRLRWKREAVETFLARRQGQ
jgi:excisionase family DNA binding protein